MFTKLGLYASTIKSLKASQVYYRIRKMLKLDCSIGCTVANDLGKAEPIVTVPELDYDPVFLERFSADEILGDKVTFLHSSKAFHWNQKWHFDDKTALWNFNLHYFELLFSLIEAYQRTQDKKYLNKSVEIISCWIDQNPQKDGGDGWSPYTIDLRLTNWLSYYSAVNSELDTAFREKLLMSIHEQYAFLSRHLEKDILGNHYFEDLITLVLCALFFNDTPILEAALKAFRRECREQILPDGMHFELSPMYHKLILEGVIRVAVALKAKGCVDPEIEQYLQPMLDAAWSLEEGLERVPLFNDSGNNVSKSLQALVLACKQHFGIYPVYKSKLEVSGYYIFKHGEWKLIVDAGQPGPKYIPGHAHCDAMSFELFCDGKPVVVNCGTYAYQCKERGFFRSTAAHNTVMVDGTEQSQCWGAFRLAKRSSIRAVDALNDKISMELQDYKGHVIQRTLSINDSEIGITDIFKGNKGISFLHIVKPEMLQIVVDSGTTEVETMPYAQEYGKKENVRALSISGEDIIQYRMRL